VATPAAQGERYEPAVGFVVTGVMAAGKSTVAELLAQRFEPRRARARRRLSKDDRAWSRPDHTRARRRGASSTRPSSAHRGQLSPTTTGATTSPSSSRTSTPENALANVVGRLEISPLYVVVLNLGRTSSRRAKQQREKSGYGEWDIEGLCASFFEETSHIGLWLDTSELSPEETVEAILHRRHDARVR